MDCTVYRVHDTSQLLTPCLLVYPELIRANIDESIRVAGSVDRLRPHVKTHKTPQIVDMLVAAGVTKHKCATLAEARMLAECSAADVLIAYPQVGAAQLCLAELVKRFPKTRFSTIVDASDAAKQLDQAMHRTGIKLSVMLDIDCGMHRTGILPNDSAVALYRQLCESRALQAAGLHVYDGHNHQSDRAERQAAVDELFHSVQALVRRIQGSDLPVPKMVCGGTPTFPIFAEMEQADLPSIECSPGTCILSDYNYGRDFADIGTLRPAAVLLTSVISVRSEVAVTLDLGYKAVASDPPAGGRCNFLDFPDAKESQHSEEHLVIETTVPHRLQTGDKVYVLPAHICPTVALHSHLQVVEGGQVVQQWPVQARDRLYRSN